MPPASHPPAARLSPRVARLRDFAGGNYIGLFMNSFIVYFLWRYTILVNMRIKVQHNPNWIDRFAVRWNNVHAMSGSVFLLIFLVGPVSKYDSPTPLPHGICG